MWNFSFPGLTGGAARAAPIFNFKILLHVPGLLLRGCAARIDPRDGSPLLLQTLQAQTHSFNVGSQVVVEYLDNMGKGRSYTLVGRDGKPFQSLAKGTLGGHRGLRIYGRLDCPSALRFIARGQYVKHRVFFLDEATAIAAGYRPCAKCLPDKYERWKG